MTEEVETQIYNGHTIVLSEDGKYLVCNECGAAVHVEDGLKPLTLPSGMVCNCIMCRPCSQDRRLIYR
jgi:hypothetical protein